VLQRVVEADVADTETKGRGTVQVVALQGGVSSPMFSRKVGADSMPPCRSKASGSITQPALRSPSRSLTAATVWRIDWFFRPRSTSTAPARSAWSTRRRRLPWACPG
jgi:hypothetical protein